MASSIPALVQPTVLRWARESIGLTTLAAARRLQLPDDRVAAWESGDAQPTIAQLRKAAETYNRPLAVFFLATPPADFDTLRDFRRVEGSTAGTWSPELHREYRRAQSQRANALELFELEETEPSNVWQIAYPVGGDEALAALARRTLLEISPLPLPIGGDRPFEHLNAWVSALEEAGVLVSATAGGRIAVSEMRAFSLYDERLPVIMVNGADGPRGRLFSLMHECAHLLLHTGGLCDMVTDTQAVSPNRQLEARCNAIAAEILMPAPLVLSNREVIFRQFYPTSWDYTALRAAAAPFGVSAEAFLRRLVTLGRVDIQFYQARRTEFLAAYEEEEARSRASSGGNWYRTTVRDLGKSYVRQVASAHRRRIIDSYTAASYLNAKVGQIDRLAAMAAVQEAV